jgi:hypothetical protein
VGQQAASLVLQRKVSNFVMQMLTLGRQVGVPKDDQQDVRPITVSNFFMKLLGAVTLKLDGFKLQEWQFGAGAPAGAERAYHKVRREHTKGRYIIRLDVCNAFNSLSRDFLQRVINHADPRFRAYIDIMYGDVCDLVVFGPNGIFKLLQSAQGTRQGDACSSTTFCRGIEEAIQPLLDKWADEQFDAKVFAYCDDLTISVALPGDVERVIAEVTQHLARAGLDINLKKSAVLFPSTAIFDWNVPVLERRASDNAPLLHGVAAVSPTGYFRVLGGNVTDQYGDFISQYNTTKTDPFFDLLDKVHDDTPTHPQVLFNILRACGSGKLVHLCSVTPPTVSRPIADHFEERLLRFVRKLCGHKEDRPLQQATKTLIHDHAGLGLPNYPANVDDLYHISSKLDQQPRLVRPSLVSNELISPDVKAQLASHANAWMFYHHGTGIEMTPTAFRICLSVRIRINPNRGDVPLRCNCNTTFDAGMLADLSNEEYDEKLCETEATYVEHTLACSQASHYTFTRRHDDVVDALCSTSMMYGISSIKEPNFYLYADGSRKRPDVTWRILPKLTTDVTIRKPKEVLGLAAKEAAKEKIDYHADAVEQMGHKFIPFAMETYGGFDARAIQLIERLAQERPDYERMQFKRDMIHAASTALQSAIASTFISAHAGVFGGFLPSRR